MNRPLIDLISKEFARSLPQNLPDFKGTPAQVKARSRLESCPAEFLRYASEVAMRIFHLRGIVKPEYSAVIVKRSATCIMADLSEKNLETQDLETRVTLFWACMARVLAIFKSKNFKPELTVESYNDMINLANEIKISALGYGLTTKRKVMEVLNGKDLSV